MSAPLTEQEFSQHVNTKFRALAGDQNFELELVEVKGYQLKENEQQGLERFSVFFYAPHPLLPQSIYSMQHEKMGQFDLFVVPIAQQGDGFRYEAVFNYYKTEDKKQ